MAEDEQNEDGYETTHRATVQQLDDGTWSYELRDLSDKVVHTAGGFKSQDEATSAAQEHAAGLVADDLIAKHLGSALGGFGKKK